MINLTSIQQLNDWLHEDNYSWHPQPLAVGKQINTVYPPERRGYGA
jgi:hypothetical protein